MSARIYLRDLRAVGYCHQGVRRWCAERGINWQDFLDNGVEVEVIRGFGDAQGEIVCRRAEKRAEKDAA